MLVFIAVVLALIPAAAIAYGFLQGMTPAELLEDEGSTHAELARRWDSTLASLKNTELERALGNLDQDDYQWLRQHYMGEAALLMKAMELEEDQLNELESTINREIQQVRLRVLGRDDYMISVKCPDCGFEVESSHQSCPGCGSTISLGTSGIRQSRGTDQ